MKNTIRIIINIILIIILLFSGYKIYTKLNDYKSANTTYTKIKLEKKESLYSKNKDFKFWLKIDNTNIDYPVVQGPDNKYYLKNDFYKQESSSGSIFMDYRNKVNDKNIILYGHNMKNKTMFNNLLKFKDESFFKENNKIRIIKDNKEYNYEVFSVYTIDDRYDYLVTSFSSIELFNSYLNRIKSKSLYKSDVSISGSDSIITLSTCSYEFKNARTVVHGKLLK